MMSTFRTKHLHIKVREWLHTRVLSEADFLVTYCLFIYLHVIRHLRLGRSPSIHFDSLLEL